MIVMIERSLGGDQIEFECEYTPGTPDYFCNGHGNYLPGDPAEAKIKSVRKNGEPLDDLKAEFYVEQFEDGVLRDVFQLES